SFDGDVLVVPLFGFGCGTEDRRIETIGFSQSGCQSLSGESAALTVFLPRGAGEISADHTFDWKYRGATAKHRATCQLMFVIAELRDQSYDLARISREHVVLDFVLQPTQ